MLALYAALALALQAPRLSAADALPVAPLPDVSPLLPEPAWAPDERPLPAFASALEHKRALEKDPLHGERFWTVELAGDPKSRRVVFLIPQFHRNPLVPIEWTSLGDAIVIVQRNIDALTTRLALAHGLRCIGTEGSWLNDIRFPHELRQPAQWAEDLARRRRVADAVLTREAPTKRSHTKRVERLLMEALKKRVALYDGVGAALHRLDEDVRIRRFGIEDEELNKRALVLLAQLQRIDEQLAELDPGGQTEVQTAMGEMWLGEIDAYERDVLRPLEESLAALDEERLRLRGEGAEGAAEDLGRFVVLAKHVQNAALRPSEVRAYTQYYRRVAEPSSDAGPTPEPRPADAKARQRQEELRALRARLQREYDAVSIDARERRAAEKVIERLGAGGTCAVVMGAVHQDALKRYLLEAGGSDVAVLVVAPYSFSEQAGSAESTESATSEAER